MSLELLEIANHVACTHWSSLLFTYWFYSKYDSLVQFNFVQRKGRKYSRDTVDHIHHAMCNRIWSNRQWEVGCSPLSSSCHLFSYHIWRIIVFSIAFVQLSDNVNWILYTITDCIVFCSTWLSDLWAPRFIHKVQIILLVLYSKLIRLQFYFYWNLLLDHFVHRNQNFSWEYPTGRCVCVTTVLPNPVQAIQVHRVTIPHMSFSVRPCSPLPEVCS